jgi:putative component of membrane protein insertase Oxa1/YidC/SpoIIIJ protein YidD
MRRLLKNPRTWLVLFAVLGALLVLDSCRAPQHQVTASLYLGAVETYQEHGRPVLKGRIQCRYSPSCSVYSAEAVEKYGIRKGLALTAQRIASCREDVPLGTQDLVP